MEKTRFSKLVKTLDGLQDKANKLNKINLESLSISEFNSTIDKARDIQSDMHKFLHDDLYHIIGMGNLSGSQLSTIGKKAKTLSVAKAGIVRIATNDKVNIVRDNGKSATYKIINGDTLVR